MIAEFQLWEKIKRIPDAEILSILDDQIRAETHDASVQPVIPPLSQALMGPGCADIPAA